MVYVKAIALSIIYNFIVEMNLFSILNMFSKFLFKNL